MKHLKPVYISILTLVIFTVALLAGMQTDWWQTEGRSTPLGETGGGRGESESVEETGETQEDHVSVSVSGSTTVGDAVSLGLTFEQLSEVLEGEITKADAGEKIKDIVTQRGLQFGVVKDELNSLLD